MLHQLAKDVLRLRGARRQALGPRFEVLHALRVAQPVPGQLEDVLLQPGSGRPGRQLD